MPEHQFNPSLQPSSPDYDPLAADDHDASEEDADAAGAAPAVADATASASEHAPEEPVDERPAAERISDLLTSMAPRRRVLLRTIAFCREPQPVDQVNARVDELQAHDESVYTAADLCNLLERAGAIERVDAQGKDADEEEQEPTTVVEDGVEYLQPAQQQQSLWAATEAGLAAVEADKPADRMDKLLADDEKYASVYQRILSMCADAPQTMGALGKAVDDDPLLKEPRLYAAHFVDLLEKCEAIEWDGAWKTTAIGQKGLAALKAAADEDDTAAGAGAPEGR